MNEVICPACKRKTLPIKHDIPDIETRERCFHCYAPLPKNAEIAGYYGGYIHPNYVKALKEHQNANSTNQQDEPDD